MVLRVEPPDFLTPVSQGLQIGESLQRRRERQEDRAFLQEQRKQQLQEKAKRDLYTTVYHLDPNAPNDDFNKDFNMGLDWYASQNPEDMQGQNIDDLKSMPIEKKRMFIQQSRNAMGIKPATPAQPEEYTLKPGEKRFRGEEVIAEVPKEISEKPEQWQTWGYGQMRNKQTGEVVKVPVAPKTGETIRSLPKGGFEIVRGVDTKISPELSKPVVTDLTKTIINNENNLSRLDRIEQQYLPGFLTYGGKLGAKISSLKSKAGIDVSPESKEFLANRRQFTQGVNQLFNAYRKEITGAAAAVKELEDLKKAMLSEDLSPIEFEAAFKEFKGELKRSNRLTRRILRDGIKGDFGKNLDKLFIAGEDDNIEDRGMELREQGLSNEEITEMLINEGF